MLITKEHPAGIDYYIQKIQSTLYAALNWENYNCYGRCYRNKHQNGYIAEVYTSANNYKEVYWDDKLSAISFFGLSDKINANEANVHLVFFVNLAKLMPGVTHRADEEVRLNAIGRNNHGFIFKSIDLWVENVLKEYPSSRRDDRLKAVDMHPIHCFRLNFSLLYNPNKC
jgi:hypothetical protein